VTKLQNVLSPSAQPLSFLLCLKLHFCGVSCGRLSQVRTAKRARALQQFFEIQPTSCAGIHGVLDAGKSSSGRLLPNTSAHQQDGGHAEVKPDAVHQSPYSAEYRVVGLPPESSPANPSAPTKKIRARKISANQNSAAPENFLSRPGQRAHAQPLPSDKRLGGTGRTARSGRAGNGRTDDLGLATRCHQGRQVAGPACRPESPRTAVRARRRNRTGAIGSTQSSESARSW
jgi:hypothetical protein